ncbi:MAG: hypothetical protein K6B68_15130 [Eubacterium sp.]|nr:hypothetical protein [Eubacterium sp.]
MNEVKMKKNKITKIMLGILSIAPVIGAAVFGVLFKFVLTDRLEERIPHSATVILLWMFASLFYIIVITNFNKKNRLIPATLGMISFIAAAIVMTPLDRYVKLMLQTSRIVSYILPVLMFAIFYAISIVWRKKVEG